MYPLKARMESKNYWLDYSFVMRSKQRKMVVAAMDRPMLVTEVQKKANLSLSETSRALRALKDEGLAECLNPKDALGRIYRLTSRGNKIKEAAGKQ